MKIIAKEIAAPAAAPAPQIQTICTCARYVDVPMSIYNGGGYTELECCQDTLEVLQEISQHPSAWPRRKLLPQLAFLLLNPGASTPGYILSHPSPPAVAHSLCRHGLKVSKVA